MNGYAKNNKAIQSKVLQVIFTFFTGALLGWCWETVWVYATKGVLANRGVLHGPWLPIYGAGCVLMLLLKWKIGDKPIRFFFTSIACSGVLEYATSWVLEAVYHKRWWDYSGMFMNLNGRICLGCLLFFGVGGSLIVYGVLPRLKKVLNRFSLPTAANTAFLLTGLFVMDTVFSLVAPNVGLGITII